MNQYKKQNFKFVKVSGKFANGKIVNIKAYTLVEALGELYKSTHFPLTRTTLLKPFHQVVTTFDFNYEGDFYTNHVNKFY
jgi:hypothetical protein